MWKTFTIILWICIAIGAIVIAGNILIEELLIWKIASCQNSNGGSAGSVTIYLPSLPSGAHYEFRINGGGGWGISHPQTGEESCGCGGPRCGEPDVVRKINIRCDKLLQILKN
jgi:hypothetical protein